MNSLQQVMLRLKEVMELYNPYDNEDPAEFGVTWYTAYCNFYQAVNELLPIEKGGKAK